MLLVEGKNGAVIRKHIGYGAIPAEHAEAFPEFYTAHLNPYLNYHRPCGSRPSVPCRRQTQAPLPGGRLPHAVRETGLAVEVGAVLEAGNRVPMLHQQAMRRSDTEAALQMQKAKLALLAKSRGPQ